MVRLKQRYLLLNILYPETKVSTKSSLSPVLFQAPTPDYVDAGRFVAHLKNHIDLLFGDFGLGVSAASLKIIYLSTATSTAILRVPRNHHRLVWAALTNITELPGPKGAGVGTPCVIRVVRVSGTIRKAEEELIRRARRSVVKAKLAADETAMPWVPRPTGYKATHDHSNRMTDVSMESIEDMSDGEIETDDSG